MPLIYTIRSDILCRTCFFAAESPDGGLGLPSPNRWAEKFIMIAVFCGELLFGIEKSPFPVYIMHLKDFVVKRKSGENPAQTRCCNRYIPVESTAKAGRIRHFNGSEARRRRGRIGHGCLAIRRVVRKIWAMRVFTRGRLAVCSIPGCCAPFHSKRRKERQNEETCTWLPAIRGQTGVEKSSRSLLERQNVRCAT